MTWLILAFMSAALLGCYDSFKKQALRENAVIPVLFLNTLFCSLIFLPFILFSGMTDVLEGSVFQVTSGGWEVHKYVVLKALIVLSSWILGYFGMKHLPLTIVGPINATRPVMVLLGALMVFGERLNGWQWLGVLLAVVSFLMLSRSGKKEGIDFKHDHWIWMIVGAAALGAVSGLYDKYLMAPVESGGVGLNRMLVQSWYNIYQCGMMLVLLVLLWWPKHRETTPFHWHWSIVFVSLFLSLADFVYFYSLSLPDAMISIVSMIRRGSVVVSFLFGAAFFHEKNLKAKAFDLALVLLGMVFLYIGSK
ncbi:MAG: DMT family transporter [Prevotella sp.]|nr:DMT family transporter [Prevotella sp.]